MEAKDMAACELYIFIIKITLTPLLMLIVSLSARRWGSFMGGVLSGMPLTSGPISIYMTIEQGVDFAQKAAVASLAGLAAIMLTYVVYIFITKWLSLWLACLLSFSVFCCASWLFLKIGSPALAVIFTVVFIAAVLFVSRNSRKSSDSPSRSLSLTIRVLTTTCMVVLVTGFANALGPSLSGVLSPLPVIAWPLIFFAHLQNGRNDAVAVIRGNATSCTGVLAFYIIVEGYILLYGVSATFAAAIAMAIVLPIIFLKALRL